MPFVKAYIHFVWSTKDRLPFLSSREIREIVWQHIRENSRKKSIFIDFVNGYPIIAIVWFHWGLIKQ